MNKSKKLSTNIVALAIVVAAIIALYSSLTKDTNNLDLVIIIGTVVFGAINLILQLYITKKYDMQNTMYVQITNNKFHRSIFLILMISGIVITVLTTNFVPLLIILIITSLIDKLLFLKHQ